MTPFSDDPRTVAFTLRQLPLAFAPSIAGAALNDLVRAAVGRTPRYIPLVWEPDDLAVLGTPGSLSDY